MKSFNFFLFRLKQQGGISNQGLLRVMKEYQGPKNKWLEASGTDISYVAQIRANKRESFLNNWLIALDSLDSLYQEFQRQPLIHFLSDEYPENLKEVYNPPAVLFYQGNLSLLTTPGIAVVGSREASAYGLAVTQRLVPELVKAGLTIVSGLARGIDTSAHQQALQANGKTIAVIGAGLDYVYPRENYHLHHYLGHHQLLLSEYPLGTSPLPYHFPARNRIIAGLSLGTLIIEAKKRSGSLITAQLALESGREVFAVPGNILASHSLGTNELIQMGAKSINQASDILIELPAY